MSTTRQKLLTIALVSSIIASLVVFAGSTAAVETAITGDNSVEKKGTLEFQSTLTIRDGERVPVDNFTLTIHPADEPDEAVEVTFAPDGTILEISPEDGVVGEGEIRVDKLRKALDITLVESDAEYGYGYGYGYDERRGDERVDFGYGYGFEDGDGDATFTYDIELDAKPFKHGDYELFVSVNSATEEGLFESNHKSFEVLNPSGVDPAEEGESEGDGVDAERGNGKSANHRNAVAEPRPALGVDFLDFGTTVSALSADAVGR
jgi:hypothetical protein